MFEYNRDLKKTIVSGLTIIREHIEVIRGMYEEGEELDEIFEEILAVKTLIINVEKLAVKNCLYQSFENTNKKVLDKMKDVLDSY
ncbi:MAG: metal-sensing transcriptional repressor [Marinisporobacter sp.]|jgi:DNA-binding FrmR family transcriptional regulator|nr:metal-sensing transcriptional repressor [Marinisporobacter sp.]